MTDPKDTPPELDAELVARLLAKRPHSQAIISRQLLAENLQARMDAAKEAQAARGAEALPTPKGVETVSGPNGKFIRIVTESAPDASNQSVHSYLRLGAVPDPSKAGQAPADGSTDINGEDLAARITDFADDKLDRAVKGFADIASSELEAKEAEEKAKQAKAEAEVLTASNAIKRIEEELRQGPSTQARYRQLYEALASEERKGLQSQHAADSARDTAANIRAEKKRLSQKAAIEADIARFEEAKKKRQLAAEEQEALAAKVQELEKLGPPLYCTGFVTKDIRQAETKRLHTKGGWREHTEGNRITTTRGDKVEVVYGNYRFMSLGHQEQNAGWDLSGGHVSQSGGGNTAGKGGGAGGGGGGRGRGGAGTGGQGGQGGPGAGGAGAGGRAQRGGQGGDGGAGGADGAGDGAGGDGAEGGAEGAGGAGNSGMSWVQNWGGTWRTVSSSTKGDTDSTSAGDSVSRDYGKYSLSISGCERPWERHLLELNDGKTDASTSPPTGALSPDELTKLQLDVAHGEPILDWLTLGAGKNTTPPVTAADATQLRQKSADLELATTLRQRKIIADEGFWVSSGAMTKAQVPSFEQAMADFFEALNAAAIIYGPGQTTSPYALQEAFESALESLCGRLRSLGLLDEGGTAELQPQLRSWYENILESRTGLAAHEPITPDSPEGKAAKAQVGNLCATRSIYAQWQHYAARYEQRFAAGSKDPKAIWTGPAYDVNEAVHGQNAVQSLQALVDKGRISKAQAKAAILRKNVRSTERTWAERVESYTGSADRSIMPAEPPNWLTNLFPAMKPLDPMTLPSWMAGPLSDLSPWQLSQVPPWTADPFEIARRATREVEQGTLEEVNVSMAEAGDDAQTPPPAAQTPAGEAPAAATPPSPGAMNVGQRNSGMRPITLPTAEDLWRGVTFPELMYFAMTGTSPRTYPWSAPSHDGSAVPLMKSHSWVTNSVSKSHIGLAPSKKPDSTEPSVTYGQSHSETLATSMYSKTTIDTTQIDETVCAGTVSSTTTARSMYSMTTLAAGSDSLTIAESVNTTVGDTNSLTLGASSTTTLAATSSVTIANSFSASMAASLSVTMGMLSDITIALTGSVTVGFNADLNLGSSYELVAGLDSEMGVGKTTLSALRKVG